MKAPTEVVEVAGREVAITNPGKVLFPKAGYTKRDLVAYYHRSAPWIVSRRTVH